MTKVKKIYISLIVAVLAFGALVGNVQATNLSQTSISLSPGQSSVVYNNDSSGSIYLSNNSNSSVASVSVNGNNINIYALAVGTTTATICENNASGCGTIFINVGINGSNGTISLSQTNLSLTIGQTSVVTANSNYSYYNGSVYISSNSNSSVASASVSGNNISIYASNTGSTTITVCQSNSGVSCASIYVSVSSGYYNNTYYNPVSNTLGLSISNLVFAVGSDVTLSSANYSGMYVSNNSNPRVASALNASTTSGTVGCAGTALYSTLTGQPCFGQVNNTGGYYSSVPGCYAGATYSTFTGQPCFSNYNNQYNYNYPNTGNNSSVEILGVSAGTDTVTLCQSSGSSVCTAINVTVY